MLDRARAAIGRFFAARRIAPEMYPEVRFVPFGNVTMRISSPEDVLKISAAWRCVTLLANTTAALQWDVFRKVGPDRVEEQHTNRIGWLLSHRPNEDMSALDFRRTLCQHRLLYGNGYAEIQRDAAGRPVALWPIGPDRCEPQRDYEGRLFYRVSNPRGGFSEMTPRDIFHVRGPGWDGVRGYSIMEVGAVSLAGAATLDATASRYFGNGMNPSGILSVPQGTELSPEAAKRIEARLLERHSGAANSGKPLILDAGMEWKPTSADPEKGQFLDTRKFSVYEVCRWFGVPPYLAFATDEQPRANVETQSREFYSYGLMPLILEMEQEANFKLLSDEFGGLHTRMNTDQMFRGDYKTIAEYYQTMRAIGAFTINDILRAEGMDTIGPEGDVRHMQAQNVAVAGSPAATPPIEKVEDDDSAQV